LVHESNYHSLAHSAPKTIVIAGRRARQCQCSCPKGSHDHLWSVSRRLCPGAGTWLTDTQVWCSTKEDSITLENPGFDAVMNEHHAFAIHQHDRQRAACGILHSVAKASIRVASLVSRQGHAWVAQVNATCNMLSVSDSLLPEGLLSACLHMHAGSICYAPLGHLWASGDQQVGVQLSNRRHRCRILRRRLGVRWLRAPTT
jgi:hypothetical protein